MELRPALEEGQMLLDAVVRSPDLTATYRVNRSDFTHYHAYVLEVKFEQGGWRLNWTVEEEEGCQIYVFDISPLKPLPLVIL